MQIIYVGDNNCKDYSHIYKIGDIENLHWLVFYLMMDVVSEPKLILLLCQSLPSYGWTNIYDNVVVRVIKFPN